MKQTKKLLCKKESNSFVSMTGDDAVADDYASIAMYFENQKQHFLAGKFFLKATQYAKVRCQ